MLKHKYSLIYTVAFLSIFTAIFFSGNISGQNSKSYKVHKVDKRKKEIILQAKELKMGQQLYVNINNKKIIMKVTFPYLTSAKCKLIKESRKYFKNIKPGMMTMIYVAPGNYERAKILFIKSWNEENIKIKRKYRKTIIDIAPESEYAWFARSYFKQADDKDHEGSVIDCKKAIKINPEFWEAYIRLGDLRADCSDMVNNNENEDNSESEEVDSETLDDKLYCDCDPDMGMCSFWNEYVIRNAPDGPAKAWVYLRIGDKRWSMEGPGGARESYSKAIEFDANNATAYSAYIAATYLYEYYWGKTILVDDNYIEEPDKGKKLVDKLMKLNKKSVDGYLFLCLWHYTNNDYKNALENLNLAIKYSNKKSGLQYLMRGQINIKLKNYKTAEIDYTKSVSVGPDEQNSYSCIAYKERGKLKLKLNRTEDACMDFRKAEELCEGEVTELIKKNCK